MGRPGPHVTKFPSEPSRGTGPTVLQRGRRGCDEMDALERLSCVRVPALGGGADSVAGWYAGIVMDEHGMDGAAHA